MDFVGRIGITCFAASYAVGLFHEVARLRWPARWSRWMATLAALAGWTAHTLYLAHRGVSQHRLPIATAFESLLAVGWILAAVHLYLLVRERRLGAGLFFLPLTLGLVLYAAGLRDALGGQPDGADPAAGVRVLGVAHGVLLLAGAVLALLAAVAAAMYLRKRRELKHGQARTSLGLPSLERLDRLHRDALLLAWPLLTAGVGLGFALRQLEWLDPKVLLTVAAWAMFTAAAHARLMSDKRRDEVAWLTVAAAVALLALLLADPVLGTRHQTGATHGG